MSVFVTGATGFLGQHVVKQLLDKDYTVIAAVRTDQKGDNLLRKFSDSRLSYVTTGDASRLDAYEDVFKNQGKNIKHVIHCAFPLNPEATNYEKDILIPARDSMKCLLDSIKKYASEYVEHIVMTSGVLTMIDLSKMNENSVTFNEDSWNPNTWESCQSDFLNAIGGAKMFAEKQGWKFYEDNKNTTNIKFTTIIPSYIFGPQTFDEDVQKNLNISNTVINQAIHATRIEDIAPLTSQCVHVSDVAKAHILPLESEELTGKRLIVSTGNFNEQDILNYLNEDFPILKGKIPVGTPSKGIENRSIGAVIDNSRTLSLLGFPLKSLRDCVDDTTVQVLKHEGRL
ncbi:similar to Saccharomyces cerevisiae YOL151W GRE2 3-methylbutanal reductase and NADPH-dependent methylglyoxal reductase (D-lactaldehyde dehydrogenase) [Maudiozyma barnettii]|uniref:Similar to Saccharomyces cerevisiae YOL151W GRE2 3-methylbutanal reductase and NADPH-dependent methylglyoxal reductase (D-lactaldehyde dehydrogenase) n=1 Tax=Maudiozyma barnettii TaxID=61262 RepID=A0A8H2VKR2_9SACH|nr:uncharacterized protein KABA2_13S06600 [Kazachstania barnettii]CAB4257256.1 similar to Saccharomyces cerevisiae YOL151W GRE2 3-methylbutanal reductase and NADPH-dependent methylglyoxal reductase (D-lactaldehyde dehydrogenase) [Kazachstania barnettii]CAD1779626.1 similar to Saccharomyces cerevisiae YOL151W GRE2 3-methylbutanal reductase and NADPH-dependent methylglyoxal reductase (D-lactaldehyde dehydrogenase) [Kazachstania barnettii]